MERIVKGYWDCPYCDQKGIDGLTKHCPGCGHPQDQDTKFYLKEEKVYVEEEKAKQYGQGADWTCSYCDSLNRYDRDTCSNCGAPREENKGSYFDNQNKTPAPAPKPPVKPSFNYKLLLAILAVVAFFVILFMPKNKAATIAEKSWERTTNIESYETVKESDWDLPDGGRLYDQQNEIHHYDQVLDHYETVQVQKSRQVVTGYDTEYHYRDNGDGTFTEYTTDVPIYSTEYYYEDEDRPVYISVPRYQTKYYYEIERWIYKETLEAHGKDDTPYWPERELKNNERLVQDKQKYTIVFNSDKKRYEQTFSESVWSQYKVGDKVDIKVQMGNVEINR